MPWLKRNLWLVVGGLVALGLMGFAGYFLYAKLQAESEITAQLESQTQELDNLTKVEPSPGNDKVNNIEAAKKQDQELQVFVAESRKTFVPVDCPKGLDSGQFKLLMDNTIAELQREAEKAGTKLQPQYYFTFSAQKPIMQFEAATIEPLTMMLMEIRTLCKVLFKAKILALDGIRRVAVAVQDTPNPLGGPSDFWNKKPTTNDLAILVPYEFVFHSFTPELAAVLEGIGNCPNPFVVKSIVVDTAASQLLEKTAEPAAQMPFAYNPMMNPAFMSMMRYGMRYSPRMMMPPPVMTEPVATPAGRGGLTPMLDEKPFRAVMWVEIVRLKEPGKEGTKEKRPRRGERTEPTTEPAAAPGEAAPNPSN